MRIRRWMDGWGGGDGGRFKRKIAGCKEGQRRGAKRILNFPRVDYPGEKRPSDFVAWMEMVRNRSVRSVEKQQVEIIGIVAFSVRPKRHGQLSRVRGRIRERTR